MLSGKVDESFWFDDPSDITLVPPSLQFTSLHNTGKTVRIGS